MKKKKMKSISKPTFKSITRYKDYSQIEYIKKKMENGSPVYVVVTILELGKLPMYDLFFFFFFRIRVAPPGLIWINPRVFHQFD